MSSQLTVEEQHALDAAGDLPAHVLEAGTGQSHVLLPWADFEWLRNNVPGVSDAFQRCDSRTQRHYACLSLADYERVKALFEEDPVTPERLAQRLRAFGLRAGWDDPKLDVYEEYRKPA